jgi:hypothetical protein
VLFLNTFGTRKCFQTLSFAIPGWNEQINFEAASVAKSSESSKGSQEEAIPSEHHDFMIENEAVEVNMGIPELIKQVDLSETLQVNTDTLKSNNRNAKAGVTSMPASPQWLRIHDRETTVAFAISES